MALDNRKNLFIAVIGLLLVAVAAIALIHTSGNRGLATPTTVVDSSGQPAAPAYQPAAPAYQPGAQGYQGAQAPQYAQNSLSGSTTNTDGYYPIVPAPVYINQAQAAPQQAVAAPQDGGYTYGGGYRTYREDYRHHGRSKKHSIEIVAGTAAAGAAIGAIAGGGPGAAIGAISGAGAGFTYDRLTHNR